MSVDDMDTKWFAVDEDGEIGLFDTGSYGVVPVPSGYPEWLKSPEPISVSEFRKAGRPGAISLRKLRRYSREIIALDELMDWPPENPELVKVNRKDFIEPMIEGIFVLLNGHDGIPDELRNFVFDTSLGPLITAPFCRESWFRQSISEGLVQRFWTRSLNPERDLESYRTKWESAGVHLFKSVNDCSAFEPYVPATTAENPIIDEALDGPLRSEAQRRRIPNLSFRDREAWNPYESFANCFSRDARHFYKGADDFTFFPTPNRRNMWDEAALFEAFDFWDSKPGADSFYSSKYRIEDLAPVSFFAIDDAGEIALFNGNPFAARPADTNPTSSSDKWEEFLIASSNSEYGALPYDLNGLNEIDSAVLARGKEAHRIPAPFLALLSEAPAGRDFSRHCIRVSGSGSPPQYLLSSYSLPLFSDDSVAFDEVKTVVKIWRAGWAAHWLEYPFGPITPRRFGFFHYDMSFLYAGPFCRITTPKSPVRLRTLPEELAGVIQPVRLHGVKFAEVAMIQPFEYLECRSNAPFWLDGSLSRVHATPDGRESLDPAREGRILRRAQAHYQMVAKLGRRDLY